MTDILETRKIDQLPPLAAIDPADLIPIQPTAGPMQRVSAEQLRGNSLLTGHKRSSAAIQRSAYSMWTDVFPLTDYITGGGAASDAGFAAALTDAAAEGKKRLILPSGKILKLTNAAMAAADMTLEGDGESSIVRVGANNSNCLSWTAARGRVKGLRFEGDGTTTLASNGLGINLTGEDFTLEDCSFNGFGQGAVAATAAAAKGGPMFVRPRVRGTVNANGIEFYIQGLWRGVDFRDPDFLTANALWGIFAWDNGTTGFEHLDVQGGEMAGYQGYAIGIADENPGGENRMFGVSIDKTRFKNCRWGAVKAKNQRGVSVTNTTSDLCGSVDEAAGSGQIGVIQINSIGLVRVSSNILRGTGAEGIRVVRGPDFPFSSPDGVGRAIWEVSHNFVDHVGTTLPLLGNGISALVGLHQLSVHYNHVRGATRFAYEISGAPGIPIHDASIVGNTAKASAGASGGIYVSWCRTVRTGHNHLEQVGGSAAFQAWDCGVVVMGGADSFIDASIPGYGAYFNNVKKITVAGRMGNSVVPAHAVSTAVAQGAQCFYGASIYEAVIGGNTGAASPPVHGGEVTASIAGNTMTVTVAAAGQLAVGCTVSAPGVKSGTKITALGTGTGGTGTYTLSTANAVASSAMQIGGGAVADGTVTWQHVGKHKQVSYSLGFAGTCPEVHINPGTDLSGATAGEMNAAPSGTMRRPSYRSGTIALAAGTATVPLTPAEIDAGYRLHLSSNANETIRWANKAVGAFDIVSSNNASTASVDWEMYR